jgi:hypothetical protein
MKAKQIGHTVDRNAPIHTPKPRNTMPKLDKLLKQGRLLPLYSVLDETLYLVGYQRKPTSRKAHHRPFRLKEPISLGPITNNPETIPEPPSTP